MYLEQKPAPYLQNSNAFSSTTASSAPGVAAPTELRHLNPDPLDIKPPSVGNEIITGGDSPPGSTYYASSVVIPGPDQTISSAAGGD